MKKQVYWVEDGLVSVWGGVEEPDYHESVLALASSASEALEMAKAFDAGKLQPDNLYTHGATFPVLQKGERS